MWNGIRGTSPALVNRRQVAAVRVFGRVCRDARGRYDGIRKELAAGVNPNKIEFQTADGDTLAASVPATGTRVLKYLQARMPYGLFVPDVA
jgi:hypothetical protein